jgi:pyruvate dehydrogenase E2 component (dihydrolipoamide acetyltransferase)
LSIELTMPRLSQDMESGTIVEWLKHEGDPVERGEVILVVETDKANVDVEAPDTGVLLRIMLEEGTEALVGAPLAVIGAPGESVEPRHPAAAGSEGGGPRPTMASPDRDTDQVAVPAGADRRAASPAARRAAKELGVDLSAVTASGAGGMVSEADVRAHADRAGHPASETATATPGDDVEVIPLEGMRRRIADQMALSRRTAADVTTVIDVTMDPVARARASSGLSYTAYVAWAVARTLPEYPDLNATFVDDRIRRHREVNLGVAVALDEGLVVPVVRGAQRSTPRSIEDEVGRLAALAREGRIQPADLSGASFTVTNSGTFGSLLFTPIINVPEVAILGFGRVADVPVIRDGEVVPGKVAYLCLSYDHRVVDGATAVKFLAAVKRRLEDVETETTA